MAVTHPTTMRNSIADTVCSTALNSGKLVFRVTGSTANAPGTAVATLTLNATAFGAASSGTKTAGAITSDTAATGGTIAFATVETSGGTVSFHCAVGTSGSDINMNTLTVGAGATVACTSLTYTAPA